MSRALIALTTSLALTTLTQAQHAGDITLTVDANRITTDHRVYGAEFGELFDNFTNEPGFDSLPNTFTPGSTITFSIRGALREWTGTAFAAIPSAQQLAIGFGPLDPVLTPLTHTVMPGFALAAGSNGQWHRHLEYTILTPAATGIYLLELDLTSSTPTTQPSLPFWIVFNQNMPETDHDAAIQWAEANIVPAPTSAAALILLGTLGSPRRRNR